MEKETPCKTKQKKARMAVLADRGDFKENHPGWRRTLDIDKRVSSLKVHNNPRCVCITTKLQNIMKQKLKGVIDESIITVWDFSTSLSGFSRSSRQNQPRYRKPNTSLTDFSWRFLIDIYRTFQPATAEYVIFPSVHVMFTHKMFSDHNGIKVEMHNWRITRKSLKLGN